MIAYVEKCLGSLRSREDVSTALSLMIEDPSYWRFLNDLNAAFAAGEVSESSDPPFPRTPEFLRKLRELVALTEGGATLHALLKAHEQQEGVVLPKAEVPASWKGPAILGFMDAPIHPKVKKLFLGQAIGHAAKQGVVILAGVLPENILHEFLDIAIDGEKGNLAFISAFTNQLGFPPPPGIEPLDMKKLGTESEAFQERKRRLFDAASESGADIFPPAPGATS